MARCLCRLSFQAYTSSSWMASFGMEREASQDWKNWNMDWGNHDSTIVRRKQRFQRGHRRRHGRQRHELHTLLVKSILEEHTRLKEQMDEHQWELNNLKNEIYKINELPDKLYDHLAEIASGFGAIQNRLGEFHQQRPGGGLRYKGL